MKKLLQRLVLSFLTCALFSLCAVAQTKRAAPAKPQTATAKFEGVYAGTELFYTLNGLSLNTYTYFFRPDGTYADQLDEPDWKTRVDGTFTIRNKIISIVYAADKEPYTIEIRDDKKLKRGGSILQKFSVMNTIPAIRLENKSASGSGGISTGNAVPYVGVFSNRLFVFDGVGRFSNNASTSVAVSGENIGGGGTNNNKGNGTYTIKDSVLTLKYTDGTVVTKSFFYNAGEAGDELAALIDGRFYFESKPDENETTGKTEPEALSENAPDAASVLKAANRVHGGAKLDALKVIRIKGRLTGANGALNHDAVIIYDFVKLRQRSEFSQNGEYDTIEQLDGARSFAWNKGRKNALLAERAAEMRQSFDTGIFGLRADVLKTIKVNSITVDREKNLKTLRISINGKEYGWILDAQNRLVAEASVENGAGRTDLSADFRDVNGILLPFANSSQIGALTLELKITSIETNPVLTEKDWAIPQ